MIWIKEIIFTSTAAIGRTMVPEKKGFKDSRGKGILNELITLNPGSITVNLEL